MDITIAPRKYETAVKVLQPSIASSTTRPAKTEEKPKGHSTRDTFVDGPKGASKSSSDKDKKIDKLVDAAKGQIGYKEGRGNSNKFSKEMAGKNGQAWCADFVSWAAKQAGLSKPKSSLAQGIADQLKAKGQWKGRHDPKKGDAVTFQWKGNSKAPADHVGIVEKVFEKNGKKYITYISGNSGRSSDSVTRRTMAWDDKVIMGYGTMIK
ncbi:CHAP domain-containing protein [Vitiosangium sp. GDMCC 1.1324]|uniref:C40 family peptidase n=1 Tax=Vitiosangium sp. (strain GDMCC 1.1324) TaxID=2138576 RepID=UPI00130E52CB|nr:CHAP domain-containing protein [Vitiosangium sp. GDMCC 1.1324]